MVKCIGTFNWSKCVLIVLSVSSPEKCFQALSFRDKAT